MLKTKLKNYLEEYRVLLNFAIGNSIYHERNQIITFYFVGEFHIRSESKS